MIRGVVSILICLIMLNIVDIAEAQRDEQTIVYASPFLEPRDGNRDIFIITFDPYTLTGLGEMREVRSANLTEHPADDNYPRWSPDGSQIAFSSNRDGNYDIFVMNADGSNLINLTQSTYDEFELTWSPDGNQIAFSSNRDGNYDIFVMNADGSNPTPLVQDTVDNRYPDWSPNGGEIIFTSEADGSIVLSTITLSSMSIEAVFEGEVSPLYSRWSPDGESIIFSDQNASPVEIFIVSRNGDGMLRLEDITLGGTVAWSPDNKHFVFSSLTRLNYMSADGSRVGPTGFFLNTPIQATGSAGFPDWYPVLDEE